ncbi:MAG: SRPBCC family protein [Actinomycetota bacterium]|nr:SRPBCC family protein [Actinomycetota bacterium]
MSSVVATVIFQQPPDVVFGYLADPRNRPEWQSSLRAVEMRDEGEPHVGMRWRDLTSVGFRPDMSITELAPYRVWGETGAWHGITADLTLRFTAVAGGTRVAARAEFAGEGAWGLVSTVVRHLAPNALGHDLERASRLLTARTTGQ